MKNIFLFIRRNFNFLCFVLLQVVCIIMLKRYSETHEAFFDSAANEITGRINQQYSGFSSYFTLKEINRQLAEQNLALLNQQKADFQATGSQHKVVLDSSFRDSTHRTRRFLMSLAQVVGNSVVEQNNYVTLDKGSAQGVKKGMSVVGPEGIVGVIINVSENYSIAMSLLNRSSRISAMLKKDKSVGSIEWDGNRTSYLTLKAIPKSAKVARGDSVLTSMYSTNFPPGMMIGTIDAVNFDPSTNFFVLRVKTATNFFTLQYVYLVENFRYDEQVNLEKATENK